MKRRTFFKSSLATSALGPGRASRVGLGARLAGSRPSRSQSAGPDEIRRRLRGEREVLRCSRRSARAGQEVDPRRLRIVAGGIGVGARPARSAVRAEPRIRRRQGEHHRHAPQGSRAVRGVRERRLRARRRLRRHAAVGRPGSHLRTADAPDDAGPAARVRLVRARAALGKGSDPRVSRRRRSRVQDCRGHFAASLQRRISHHRHDWIVRQRGGVREAAPPERRADGVRAGHRGHRGRRLPRQLRLDDEAVSGGPRLGKRHRGGGPRGARLDRRGRHPRSAPRLFPGGRRRLRSRRDRRAASASRGRSPRRACRSSRIRPGRCRIRRWAKCCG